MQNILILENDWISVEFKQRILLEKSTPFLNDMPIGRRRPSPIDYIMYCTFFMKYYAPTTGTLRRYN